MQIISTCLWFDNEAEEAAKFYTSVFKNSKITQTTRYGKEGFEIHGRPAGSVMTVTFELDGHKYMGLNGGPIFKFNESVSQVVECNNQEEMDYFWNKLSEGGDKNAQQCGWLKDKFGLSWQIVPKAMAEMMADKDPKKTGAVMTAMLQMKKIDLKTLQEAYKKA